MAFWEVHAPLGGLSLAAASRGQEGWDGGRGLAKGMGSCGSGDGDVGGPVGVGTPAASPWSREGRILQGNAGGGRGGEGGIAEETNRGGRLSTRERYRYESTAPERAGRGRKKDDKHHLHLGYQSRNMYRAAAEIRPSEGMTDRLEGGFLLVPRRDNT